VIGLFVIRMLSIMLNYWRTGTVEWPLRAML